MTGYPGVTGEKEEEKEKKMEKKKKLLRSDGPIIEVLADLKMEKIKTFAIKGGVCRLPLGFFGPKNGVYGNECHLMTNVLIFFHFFGGLTLLLMNEAKFVHFPNSFLSFHGIPGIGLRGSF